MITHYHSTARARVLEILEKPKVGSWTHAVEPTESELDKLAKLYSLDRDLLKDAVDVYEAPRLEVDGNKVYIYTRYCNPAGSEVATEPLLIVYTSDNVVTIMLYAHSVLDQIINGKAEVLTTQKTKIILRILEQINRSYAVQLSQAGKKILQIRGKLRKGGISNVEFVSFIDLEEDLNEFLTALQPQAGVLTSLRTGRHMRLYEDDQDLVEDLTLSTSELIELTKSRLRALVNFRQAYDTIVSNNLNTAFKRLTSIGIFLTIPMIAAGLWGMNVFLPFADNHYAFWIIVSATAALTGLFVWNFKKRGWV